MQAPSRTRPLFAPTASTRARVPGWPLVLALLLVGCDWSGPTWPDGATLEIEPVSSRSIRVAWPEAEDDNTVDHYWVSLDGASAVRAGGDATSAVVEGLEPTHPHRIYVVAVDEHGNHSVSLRGEGRTLDNEAPRFGEGARLTADLEPVSNDEGHYLAQLSWPMARDDAGVVEYIVLDDGEERLRTRSLAAVLERTSRDLSGISVVAVDHANNRSSPLVPPPPKPRGASAE